MSVNSGDVFRLVTRASPSGGAAPRARVPERGVGDRLQRLVQVPQLVGDHRQLLPPFLTRVQPRELLDDRSSRPSSASSWRSVISPCSTSVAKVYIRGPKRANGEGTRCKSGTVPPL